MDSASWNVETTSWEMGTALMNVTASIRLTSDGLQDNFSYEDDGTFKVMD